MKIQGYATETMTREEMKKLKDGDTFFINGEFHVAIGDAHMSGDATCDEYIVYDENGNSWFENDFVEDKELDNNQEDLDYKV